jgi:hypothetical protein
VFWINNPTREEAKLAIEAKSTEGTVVAGGMIVHIAFQAAEQRS